MNFLLNAFPMTIWISTFQGFQSQCPEWWVGNLGNFYFTKTYWYLSDIICLSFWGYRKIDIIYISKPVKRESFFLEQLQNKDRKLELWTLWLKSNCYFFFVPVLSLERAVQEIALLIYSWFDYIFSLPQSWYFGIIVPNYPSFSVKSLSEH